MAYSFQVLKVEGQAGITAEMVMVAAATIITVRTTAVVKNASGADRVPQAVPWGALWT